MTEVISDTDQQNMSTAWSALQNAFLNTKNVEAAYTAGAAMLRLEEIVLGTDNSAGIREYLRIAAAN